MITPLDMTGREGVLSAIRVASADTGVDFDYLMRTAQRESSLNPKAKAATSSAAGLFQFIEQTWLGVVKRHGAEHGLSAHAAAIEETPGGRFRMADEAQRREILALRNDPEIAARMAGELTAENRGLLERRVGRPVTEGELYAAHFLGPSQAARLIAAAQTGPAQSAADLFPGAAEANRSIFYATDGGARTVEDVYARLTSLPATQTPADSGLPDMPPLLLAQLAGTDMQTGTIARPAPSSMTGAGSWSRAPLVLSPQVVEILAALSPPPQTFQDPSRTRQNERDRICTAA